MPTIVGHHSSHEQFAPSQSLRLVQRAEAAGFTAGLNSDHFFPWTDKQGQPGFAWSWMGAALATTGLSSLGVVNAPGQRYHPAIIAQALDTLGETFPGRVWAALGSGQLRGETVTHHGHVEVEDAKLYTRPAEPPLLIGAAITEATAEWVGSWADGLITTSGPTCGPPASSTRWQGS